MALSGYSTPSFSIPKLPSFDAPEWRKSDPTITPPAQPIGVQERTSSGTQPVGTNTGLTDAFGGGGIGGTGAVNPFAYMLNSVNAGMQSSGANNGHGGPLMPPPGALNPTDPNAYQGMNPGEAQRLFRGTTGGNGGGAGGFAQGFATGGGAIQPQSNGSNPFQWGNQNPLKRLEDAIIGPGGF